MIRPHWFFSCNVCLYWFCIIICDKFDLIHIAMKYPIILKYDLFFAFSYCVFVLHPRSNNFTTTSCGKGLPACMEGIQTICMGSWPPETHLRGYSDWFGLGLTIVDSLDTMFIMGLEEGMYWWHTHKNLFILSIDRLIYKWTFSFASAYEYNEYTLALYRSFVNILSSLIRVYCLAWSFLANSLS